MTAMNCSVCMKTKMGSRYHTYWPHNHVDCYVCLFELGFSRLPFAERIQFLQNTNANSDMGTGEQYSITN